MGYIIIGLIVAFGIWMAMTPTIADREIAKKLEKDIADQERSEREAEKDD